MRKCLIVGVDTPPSIALLDEMPWSEFEFNDRVFSDVVAGDWNGFYDWLRTEAHEIIGVRFSPFRENDFVLTALDRHSYVNVSSGRNMEIFFSDHRDFSAELSGDQDFGENRIMSTESEEYLLTFGVDESQISAMQKWLG